MAFVKRKSTETTPQDSREERRSHERDMATLIELLQDENADERRHAARDLAQFPDSTQALADSLCNEKSLVVRQAIFDSLLSIGGKDVVDLLIPHLKSEDANLRNGVIEVLQGFPQEVAPRIASLLNDPDSDVRIFAVDVLQLLAHPKAPDWLLEVIRDEEHVNVIGAAVDRLAEMGQPHMIPDLERLKERFSDVPYICFSVDVCLKRLSEG
ncbi:MAG: HEAT repeat domain-containing protein [Pseudomonadota bacterium]